MNKYLPAFLKAILAGVMIATGACAYLTIDNHYIGAMLFTIGLFTIYSLDFYLYTGKVGFFLQEKDIVKIGVIWFGNIVGVVATAFGMMQTRMVHTTELIQHASNYAAVKLNDGYLSIFILAIFCGLMMYIGAAVYLGTKNTQNSVGGYIGLFLCVMVFLLLGFEHSIANVFYFTAANAWNVHSVLALGVVTLGNAVGGMLIPFVSLPFANIEAH